MKVNQIYKNVKKPSGVNINRCINYASKLKQDQIKTKPFFMDLFLLMLKKQCKSATKI